MDIRRCYDLFLTDRKVSGCRESTLRFYEYVIGKLIHYLTSTDSDSSVEDLQTHILPFFQHLQQQNLSPSTYHTLFKCVGALVCAGEMRSNLLPKPRRVISSSRLPCPASGNQRGPQ